MENQSIYVGQGKALDNGATIIELNINQLKEALAQEDIKKRLNTFYSKKEGKDQTVLKLYLGPLKEPSKYRTHSLKVINWDSKGHLNNGDDWPA